MNDFETLIDQIIEDAGLDGMPEEYRNEYRAKILQEAQKALGIRAMRELTPEQIDEFNELALENAGDTERIQKYLQDNIPDFEGVMREALDEFRDNVIEAAQRLTE